MDDEKPGQINDSKNTPRIPSQLHDWQFILVKARSKEAFEKDWPTTANYAHDDPRLLAHLATGGDYGVLAGPDHVIIETDSGELQRLVEEKLPPTFTQRSPGHGGKHFFYNGSCRIIALFDRVLPVTDQNIGHVKSGSSYVVGPGCIHPNGQRYMVVDDRPIATVTGDQILNCLAPYMAKRAKAAEASGWPGRKPVPDFDISKLADLASLRRLGDEYWGPHPVHGSTTGHNFWLNPAENVCTVSAAGAAEDPWVATCSYGGYHRLQRGCPK